MVSGVQLQEVLSVLYDPGGLPQPPKGNPNTVGGVGGPTYLP